MQTFDISPDFPFGAPHINLDGRIPFLALDPANDSVLYRAGDRTGIWKSTDGARTWHPSSRGLRNGIIEEYAWSKLLYATTSKDGRGFNCEGCTRRRLVGLGGCRLELAACQLVLGEFSGGQHFQRRISSARPFVATDSGRWPTQGAKLLSGWTTISAPNGLSASGAIRASASYG